MKQLILTTSKVVSEEIYCHIIFKFFRSLPETIIFDFVISLEWGF